MEALVGTAVFSLLIFTVFSSFDSFMASSKMIQGRQKKEVRISTLVRVMTSDLEQLCILSPALHRRDHRDRFRLYTATSPVETFPSLSFTSLTRVRLYPPLSAHAAGAARITYYVQAHGERFDLHRADRPIFLEEEKKQSDPCTDPILIQNIQSLEMEFINGRGQTFQTWDSQDAAFDWELPWEIRLKIHFLSPDGPADTVEIKAILPMQRSTKK